MKSESVELLEKAEENIQAGDILIKARFFEIAVSRAYYAIFYIAEALLSVVSANAKSPTIIPVLR